MRIYSYVAASPAETGAQVSPNALAIADLIDLTAEQRREKLLNATLSEAGQTADAAATSGRAGIQRNIDSSGQYEKRQFGVYLGERKPGEGEGGQFHAV
jgi:hypothetical protein